MRFKSRLILLLMPVIILAVLVLIPSGLQAQNKINRKAKIFKRTQVKPPKNMTKGELDPEETDFAKTLTYLTQGHYFKPNEVKKIKKIIDLTKLTPEEKGALHLGLYNQPMSKKDYKLYKIAVKKRAKAKNALDKFTRKRAKRKLKQAKKNQMNQGNMKKKINQKAKKEIKD